MMILGWLKRELFVVDSTRVVPDDLLHRATASTETTTARPVAVVRRAVAARLRIVPIVLACIVPLLAVPVFGEDAHGDRRFAAPDGGPMRPEPSPGVCGPTPCRLSPVRQGMVRGFRLIAVLLENGTNGQADAVHLFVHGAGGNGGATADLGVVRAQDGDRMDVVFAGGAMFLTNDTYGPGEAHCCPSHVVAAKWVIAGNTLSYAGRAVLPVSQRASPRALAAAIYRPR